MIQKSASQYWNVILFVTLLWHVIVDSSKVSSRVGHFCAVVEVMDLSWSGEIIGN